ncbi:uncharacterized protein BDV17DRAFT_22627 [Aspergillus undulatus]|uniref:uncharacterized protein n=1 Tax=Aspergillus undulatus TaxID=1810928 RepID=UPI003CCCCE38
MRLSTMKPRTECNHLFLHRIYVLFCQSVAGPFVPIVLWLVSRPALWVGTPSFASNCDTIMTTLAQPSISLGVRVSITFASWICRQRQRQSTCPRHLAMRSTRYTREIEPEKSRDGGGMASLSKVYINPTSR